MYILRDNILTYPYYTIIHVYNNFNIVTIDKSIVQVQVIDEPHYDREPAETALLLSNQKIVVIHDCTALVAFTECSQYRERTRANEVCYQNYFEFRLFAEH